MADSSLAGASTGAATGQTVPPPHPPTATSAGAQQQRSSSGTPQPDDSSSAAPIAAGAGATRSFAAPQQTTHERLSTQTVGLVALSDFRKRRAEVLEQQEREARERALAQQRQSRLQGQQGGVGGGSGSGGSGSGTPVERGSRTGTPSAAASGGEGATDGSGKEGGDAALKRKKAKLAAKKGRSGGPVKLSFEGDDEDDEGAGGSSAAVVKKVKTQNGDSLSESRPDKPADADSHEVAAGTGSGTGTPKKPSGGAKLAPNTALAVLPRPLTKAAMARDAAERDALRRRFLATQERVRATEIAVPFVFYDGSSIPGGTVRMKKGDFVWVFLDRSRKMGARKAAAGSKTGAVADAETKAGLSRKEWARVGVDDLMLVRGSVIIPHHYDFYYFIINKTLGPGGRRLFNYSDDAPEPEDEGSEPALLTSGGSTTAQVDIESLEGANDDPSWTKVVDRRWYERNKHIYPASVWQKFDPEKNYEVQIRRDAGGNTFFFS